MDLSINEGTLVVTGGPGHSVGTAIVIKKTPKGLSAAAAEHLLLTQRYGRRGRAWTLKTQDLLKADGRVYDTFRIVLLDGTERALFFDVTDWLARVQESPRWHFPCD
ncbi:MAG TPA: hypothetical protein VGZ27_03220 [Vicinamibacterales bacterium]|jgi:hypothetical protein|nr:hypothetical protein [Vicinamibacterales bacterium]